MAGSRLNGVGSLQEQVRRVIVQDITEGGLAAGVRLPTEKEYVDRLGVSLVTVRSALASLVQAGQIERASGRGTFVAQAQVPYEISLMSSTTESLRAAGVPFDTDMLFAGVDDPPEGVRSELGLRRNTKAFRLLRVVTVRGRPAILLQSWLRRAVALPFERDRSLLDNASLYERLAERGTRLAHARGRVELVHADDDEARLLHLSFGAPLFAYTSIAHDEGGATIERARALYDATRFAITISPSVET